MNTSSGQNQAKPIIIQRNPPAVPVSPPESLITKTLPSLPLKTSPESVCNVAKLVVSPPPHPPQRAVRTILRSQTSLDQQSNCNIQPPNTPVTIVLGKNSVKSSNNNNLLLENASNEAAKLVYKTVMMGSVQNVNSGFMDSENSPPKGLDKRNRKFSVSC